MLESGMFIWKHYVRDECILHKVCMLK